MCRMELDSKEFMVEMEKMILKENMSRMYKEEEYENDDEGISKDDENLEIKKNDIR